LHKGKRRAGSPPRKAGLPLPKGGA